MGIIQAIAPLDQPDTAHAGNPFRKMWGLGYRHLVPIIPPGAPISERSTIHRRLKAGDDARGKTPGVRWPDGNWSGFDWLPHEADERDLERWHAMGAGVGVKTGQAGLLAIDADAPTEEHARIIRDAVREHFGDLPVRIGRYPKAVYLIRVPVEDTVPYQRIEFGERDGNGRLRERVEVLSTGRQFVAIGIHATTREPYRWPGDIPEIVNVPCVPAAAVADFLSALRPLLPAASEIVREGASTVVNQEALRGDPDLIERAVRATPNTSDRFPTREAYRDYGYAIKAAMPDDESRALALFQEWAARWVDGDNDPGIVEADWRRMKPPFRRGAGWLYEIAEDAAPDRFSRAEVWFQPIPESTGLFDAPAAPSAERSDGSAALRFEPSVFRIRDPSLIPQRQWLYGRHYIRRFVSSTVAPGGVGKSSLAIVEALAMATGKPLLGVQPAAPCRVWVWNGEDPADELERRVAAAVMHYGLTEDDIGDRLLIDSGRVVPITLAKTLRDGARIKEPVSDALVSAIRRFRIDALIIDPFISSHEVSENDNNAIDRVAKEFARIADLTDCAVELVHHVRKKSGGDTGSEVTVEDGRGAGALLAAARSARALNRMTKTEAEREGLVANYRTLFRFHDEPKGNLAAPPATDRTQWMQTVSVTLPNGGGTGTEALMFGDSVGVVTLFDRQSVQPGRDADVIERALDLVRAEEWLHDARAGDGWIGVPIARALGLDPVGDRAELKGVIAAWIHEGHLALVTRKNANRKPRTYVEARPKPQPKADEPGSVFE